MYCSKCGSVLSDCSDFCSHCGVRCIRCAPGVQTRITVPFLLILLIGSLPLFLSLLEIISSINTLNEQGLVIEALQAKKIQIDFWLIAEMIPCVLCILIVTALVLLGRIDIQQLTYKDLLIWVLVVILSDEGVGRDSFIFLSGCNDEPMLTAVAYFNKVYVAVFQPHVCKWVVLAISLWMRCRPTKYTKRLYLIAGIILVVWGMSVNVLRMAVAETMCESGSAAVYPYLLHLLSTFSIYMPVGRMTLLYAAVLTWQKNLQIMQLAVIIGIKWIMVYLLRPILVFELSLGVAGLPLANTLAYCIAGLLCMIALSMNKKKKRAAA